MLRQIKTIATRSADGLLGDLLGGAGVDGAASGRALPAGLLTVSACDVPCLSVCAPRLFPLDA